MHHYLAREDSFLLAEQVKKHAKGDCLDMGTGSGILALAAEKKATKVVAADIDKKVIDFCKKNIHSKKIRFIQSDLFNNVRERFDTISFNPPYLPAIKGEPKSLALKIAGGKHGYEIIDRFLGQASAHLNPDGKILIVFSSLTNKEKVNEIIETYLFEFKEISSQKLFAETLHVYLIKKSNLLKELEQKKIKNIKKITKGHRGIICSGNLKNKKIIVKHQRKNIWAKETVKREAGYLRLLNKHNIGPKLIFAKDDYFIAGYIKGKLIKDFLKTATRKQKINIIKNILKQCYALDQLKINKEEMHNPYKHIIISKNPMMIDFERANKTTNPKNVTQFCQYISKILRIDLIDLARQYKLSPTKQNFSKIIKAIK